MAALETVEVTPEMASTWLVKNTSNRTMKTAAVKRYAADMAAGEWTFNGETIKFGEDGVLLDGQNRLQACVEAGVSFRTVVVHGLTQDAQDTTDVGVRRGLADVLSLRGESNTRELASCLVSLWRYQTNPREMSQTRTPSVPTSLALLESHPGIKASMSASEATKRLTGLRTSIGGTLRYIFDSIDAEDAQAFWERLTSGAGLAEDSPILRLREVLIADRAEHTAKMSYARTWALVVKAWNMYREGKPCKRLQWSPGGANPEEMPIPQ